MRTLSLLLLLICAPASAAAEPPPIPDAPLCPEHCLPRAELEAPTKPVDLNAADENALLELPGIGPARARAILAYRSSHGAFRSLSQLLAIKGIGRSLLKQLRPLVTL